MNNQQLAHKLHLSLLFQLDKSGRCSTENPVPQIMSLSP